VDVLLARDPEHMGHAFSFEAFDDQIGDEGLGFRHLCSSLPCERTLI
jgi:hypothetical protein